MSQVSEYLYSYQNVIVLVGGVAITGFAAADDAISIEPLATKFNSVAGADGHAVASAIIDYRSRINLRLLQTSSSNTYLSTLLNAYRAGVYVPTPFVMKDAGGNDFVTAKNCFIENIPTVARGANANTNTWQLLTLNSLTFIGGSTPL